MTAPVIHGSWVTLSDPFPALVLVSAADQASQSAAAVTAKRSNAEIAHWYLGPFVHTSTVICVVGGPMPSSSTSRLTVPTFKLSTVAYRLSGPRIWTSNVPENVLAPSFLTLLFPIVRCRLETFRLTKSFPDIVILLAPLMVLVMKFIS